MIAFLLEEVTSTLPNTPAQVARIMRAVEECDAYTFTDRSEIYEEPAVRVETVNGGSYLVFLDGCTCADFKHRVAGSSEVEMCKHQVACYIQAQFTYPVEVAASPVEAGEETAIEFDYVPGPNGELVRIEWEVPVGGEEFLADEPTDRELLGV